MITRVLLMLCLAILSLAPLPKAEARAEQGCSPCSVIERALKDAQELKAGMARRDIEAHNFVMSGGMVVRDRTIYVYKGCEYISIEISFNLDPTVDRDFSPRDVISGVSKLTLDYPVKD